MNATTESTFTDRVNFDAVKNVLAEIARQKDSRRDYIVPTQKLTVTPDGKLTIVGVKSFVVQKPGDQPDPTPAAIYTDWAQAEKAADACGGKIVVYGENSPLPMSRTAVGQLCEKAAKLLPGLNTIPLKYADALEKGGHGDLRAATFNYLFQKMQNKLMVRTLDGKTRALLSNKFRIMDNADVFFAGADTLTAVDAVIWNARLWDDGFELFAVSKSLQGEVKRQFDQAGPSVHKVITLPDGGAAGGGGRPDIHNALVRIRNSETGCGGLSVSFGLLRHACNNTMVCGKNFGLVHLGGRQETEGLILGDDTREADAKATWLKLRDAIKTAFNRELFEEYIAKLSGFTAQKIGKAEVAVENVVKEYQITEERKAEILQLLFEGRDLTRFGLIQAVTATAQKTAGEEASRLEETGGALAELSDKAFSALVAA